MHSKSMLQRPTEKIATPNKFKKNTEQPILQWPTNKITTPNKSKNDRIYNIEELKIKNPIQKNTPGVYIHMKVNEINIGK